MGDDGALYKAPAFQFYADDFIADTAGFTAEEVGAYMRLLCSQWKNGSIPRATARQALIAGVSTARMRAIWKALESKYEPRAEDPEGLIQPRLERVRAAAADHSATQSDRGKAGAEARWHKYSSSITHAKPKRRRRQSVSTASAMLADGSPISGSTPSEDKSSSGGSVDALPPWFEAVRTDVSTFVDSVLHALTFEQRMTLGRYAAFRWCNHRSDEQLNLKKGRGFASQIEAIGAKKRFAEKTVKEFIGAGHRLFEASNSHPMHSLWAIGAALGEDAAA